MLRDASQRGPLGHSHGLDGGALSAETRQRITPELDDLLLIGALEEREVTAADAHGRRRRPTRTIEHHANTRDRRQRRPRNWPGVDQAEAIEEGRQRRLHAIVGGCSCQQRKLR
jgi:hypothetical protein